MYLFTVRELLGFASLCFKPPSSSSSSYSFENCNIYFPGSFFFATKHFSFDICHSSRCTMCCVVMPGEKRMELYYYIQTTSQVSECENSSFSLFSLSSVIHYTFFFSAFSAPFPWFTDAMKANYSKDAEKGKKVTYYSFFDWCLMK